MGMRTSKAAFALILAAAILGCDSTTLGTSRPNESGPGASSAAFSPSFDTTECPEDVRDVTVVPVSCGYLTVLEDRADPTSRSLRLLVSTIEPQGLQPAADPMIVLADIRTGGFPDYGGLVEIANRTHRIEYILDPRGRAHSDPTLDCPEVTAASPALVGLRMADPAHQSILREAVTACRDRLRAAGVHLAAYGPDAIVADVHELRLALGIGEWNAIAYGPASELAFATSGPDRDALRSITLDSPTMSQADWRTLGPAALDLAIDRLAALCEAEPACRARAADVRGAIDAAVAALEASPITLDIDGTPEAILAGHAIRVTIDGAAFLRWLRSQIGRQHPDGELILTTAAKAAAGGLSANDLIAIQLSSDVGDCLGTLPRCDVGVAWGSVYSLVCSGPLGARATDRLSSGVAARGAYATLFAPGPLGVACEAWGTTGQPIVASSDQVPTLVFRGALDPFATPPDAIGEALGSGSDVHVVEIPNGSSNVLGAYECVRSIRNAWVDHPDLPPADTSCIDAIPGISLPH
jgi:hypothetical protein